MPGDDRQAQWQWARRRRTSRKQRRQLARLRRIRDDVAAKGGGRRGDRAA
ncbi:MULTISPECIES: hypothetical protein [Micromonospora]|nr:hypothetical protein [Micromonospora tulbaghiae]NED57822.1 hypothetical protein [Micromonospora aurantiaca]